MKQKQNKTELIAFSIIATVFVIYIGILIAPHVTDNLWTTLEGLQTAFATPLSIHLCSKTFNVCLTLLLFEATGLCIVFVNHKNTKPGEEHGSSRLNTPSAVCRQIRDKDFFKNRILTKNVRFAVTGKNTSLPSLNTLVLGGMGMGKSWNTLIPNILQGNTSFVLTDPSKELVRKVGWFLKNILHYDVKVLDLETPESSFKYNFFKYLENEDDCLRIVDIIFDATVDSSESSAARQSNPDPMWENMAKSWLLALVLLLFYRGTVDEQNIETIVWLLDEDFLASDKHGNRIKTPVMALFEEMELEIPDNMASRNYTSATDGAVVTLQGIKSTLRSRIAKFLLPSIQELMKRDELALDEIGKKKTALFLAVPSEDTSFNFIVSMVYAQLFPLLYRLARSQPDNRLPVSVQFLNDEQKNFVMPKDFITYLTTGRKHGISYMMFYQEMQQIQAQFPNEYKTLIGTCTTMLYLGGSGYETNKEISDWIGSETLTSFQYNRTYGYHGSYARNENSSGRKVLEPDEVDTKLSRNEALCYVKGIGWCIDEKNDPKIHPNFRYLAGEKKGKVYDWSGKDIVDTHMSLAMKTSEKLLKADFIIDADEIEASKIEKKYNITIYGEN